MDFDIVFTVISIIVIIGLLYAALFTVKQQTACIIERFGKFHKISHSGLNWKIPLIDFTRGEISLRLMQLDVEVETKTLDNVFVRILTSVQYRILPGKIYEAFYTLENARQQIEAYVFDVVRARVPEICLDDVFSKKDEIADSVKDELKEVMNEFGYDICKALVTDIDPDLKVKAAMNEINEAQRLRIAASERAEAEKILIIKQAEAEAESKILQGKGMAGQRKAIIEGLSESFSEFQQHITDAKAQDVLSLILMAQYFDTLKDIGAHSKSSVVLLPHSPSGLHELYDQIRNAVLVGHETSRQAAAVSGDKAD